MFMRDVIFAAGQVNCSWFALIAHDSPRLLAGHLGAALADAWRGGGIVRRVVTVWGDLERKQGGGGLDVREEKRVRWDGVSNPAAQIRESSGLELVWNAASVELCPFMLSTGCGGRETLRHSQQHKAKMSAIACILSLPLSTARSRGISHSREPATLRLLFLCLGLGLVLLLLLHHPVYTQLPAIRRGSVSSIAGV
eukprot:21424-Rhodomonas_salina.2